LQVDLVCLDRGVPIAGCIEAEILSLRHQLNVLQRNSPKRVTLTSVDRLFLVALSAVPVGTIVPVLLHIKDETLHR
jgi:hypothetical protein